MVIDGDLDLGGGRRLHVYDARPAGGDPGLAVFWHHGTPNTGDPPEPLFPAAARHRVRFVSFDRPGYGRSTPLRGRNLGWVGPAVSRVADALGIDRFAVMGHSGGGSYALACAALLPGRVLGAACLSALAPPGAHGLDWFAGMGPSGEARLRAAAAGRSALEAHLAAADFDPEEFTPADHAALAGDWAWLGAIAGRAVEGGPEGMIEDELAYVVPWGVDPAQVRAPVLLVHGRQDRIVPGTHGEWLARRTAGAELWLRPGEGHVSVLGSAAEALEWLCTAASRD